MTRNGVTQISRARHYSTFNISNIADTVLYVITKDEEATMTGVTFSYLIY